MLLSWTRAVSGIREESDLGVSLGNSSAGIAYVRVDSDDDVWLIAFPPVCNGSSLTFCIAILFPVFEIDHSDESFALNEARSNVRVSIAGRAGETLHPNGQSLAMNEDNIGLKVSFQISSMELLEGSSLSISGPVLGGQTVRIKLCPFK